MRFTKELLLNIVEWDIYTWSKGIMYWDSVIDEFFSDLDNVKVLDIGARNGGTSLYFALKGLRCTCSDLKGPTENARKLHKKYEVTKHISYENLDCTNMNNIKDETFDIVAFKSVLGGLDTNNNIKKAFDEIYRILKPNGILLFCENTEGSFYHKVLRRKFKKHGNRWNYVPIELMELYLSKFKEYKIKTFGFLSCVFQNSIIVNWLDSLLCKVLKRKNHYMCYGYAFKSSKE